MHAACKHPTLWAQLQDSLKDVIAKAIEYDKEGMVGAVPICLSSLAVEHVEDREGNMVKVQDPIKVSSKGTHNSDDDNRPKSKNGRPLSYDEHKIKCGACKEPGHNRRSKKCKLNNK
jgi:hypothetical protein